MMEIEREIEKQIIPTVGVLVFKEKKVLLVKHLVEAAHVAGVYGLPAGRKNLGETEKQAAVRELFEETGLTTKEENLIDYPHNMYTAHIERADGTVSIMSVHVFICTSYSGILFASKETEPEWVSVAAVSKLNLLPNVEKAIKDGLAYYLT